MEVQREPDEAACTKGKNVTSKPAGDRDLGSGDFDFVIVANRLPVDRVTEPDGSTAWRRSPGGLVTALEPVMRKTGGAWVGWTGGSGEPPEPFDEAGMRLVAVGLSDEEIRDYYEGFSNGTLWPLYHDVIVAPSFHRAWWEAYVAVNRRFARGRRRAGRRRGGGLGAGLPAATGAGHAARAAAGPADRLLQPHPVPRL